MSKNQKNLNSNNFKLFHLLEKKQAIDTPDYLHYFVKFAPVLFISFFLLSFFSSIPSENKNLQVGVNTDVPASSISTQTNKTEVNSTASLVNHDLVISYLLNYKIIHHIASSNKSFTGYLKEPGTPFDFDSFNKGTPLNFEIDYKDLINSIGHARYLMSQEDLSIMPFKSGEVLIESEILEVTQSEHYYMVEVLKTFIQGKKVVKVLEKKIFPLQNLDNGKISYFTNILLTSSESTL